MNGKEKREQRKLRLYVKQNRCCVECYVAWPIDEMTETEAEELMCLRCCKIKKVALAS